VVQTFATDAAKRSGTLCGLCGENCIPDSWGGFAIDAKLSEFELTFPDPMHEFNVGDGDRRTESASIQALPAYQPIAPTGGA
jgi:hypothetical protein